MGDEGISPKVLDYEPYFEALKIETDKVYDIANACRAQGQDPALEVEIPQASDLADRTQKLLEFLHPRKTADHIRELTLHHDGNRELVALDVARIVCAETFLYGQTSKCKPCDGSGTIKKGYRKRDCHHCSGHGSNTNYKQEILSKTWQETLADFEANQNRFKTTKPRMALCIYHGVLSLIHI